MRYRLLGIDIDGTLLGPDHQLVDGVAEAISGARAAGVVVVLATGRSYAEAIPIWRDLHLQPPFDPLLLVGGSLVSEPDTGRTLYQKSIDLSLAGEFADALGQAGYAAMALVDRWRFGWDYLLCETGDVHEAEARWLTKTGAKVRRARSLADVADMPPPLRVSAVLDPDKAGPLAESLAEQFADKLNVHAIVAPNYEVTIVEAFAKGVDKLSALTYIGQARRIPVAAMAAIGDDVNDVQMLRGVGLGAAVPNAVGAALDVADHIASDGVVQFVRQLVDGRFD